ncbi:hypothetical protein MCOR28_011544 [Pyricularia oryzae]|nr:hypothetical protein MCOR01_011608 [Pyricularia oryzae]KAI6264574.1 hypothetical protein MCOR26_011253 [Pyricularia oryzae]KAI6330916.1 hypothetical protein MCOR28_011544 [Pyricularia oryzae]
MKFQLFATGLVVTALGQAQNFGRKYIYQQCFRLSCAIYITLSDVLTSRPFFQCGVLEAAGLGNRVSRNTSTLYNGALSTYWSLDNTRISPAYIFVPQSAEEVATAVKVLGVSGGNNDQSSKLCTHCCKFAVRNAGHTANPGSNNIQDGVTINFSAINIIIYHADKNLTSVQPGTHWGSVYEELSKISLMVLGGRAYIVGVGGLLLSGGNSFYSTTRGFVYNGVAEFEVVLVNSSIVNINANENADLYRVLKGGSNNFGVVTRFDLNIFKTPATLWGGSAAFPFSTSPKVISAMQNFVTVLGNEGRKSDSAIAFWTYTQGETPADPLINSALHNVDGTADAPGLAEFLNIPGSVTSALRTDTFAGFTNELELPQGNYNAWRTLTFKNNRDIMAYAVETYLSMVKELEAEPSLGFTAQYVFQGLSVEQFRQAAANGGNMLGLEDRSENLVLFFGMVAYKNPKFKKLIDAKMTTWVDSIKTFAVENGADDEFLFLNYADLSQNPLGSYGDKNIAFMEEVVSKYDPNGMF